ncbi:MAG: cytochrome c biogenesis protein CcdA [Lentisphaeria bacterium]|nr:cytochrome c biogenesis protein CcdA [Lentisphaeria bacterium]
MPRYLSHVFVVCLLPFFLFAAEHFNIEASLSASPASARHGKLRLMLDIPAEAYLYEAQMHLSLPDGVVARRGGGMRAVLESEEEGMVYKQSGDIEYQLEGIVFPLQIVLSYQGCVKGMCYLPEQKSFSFAGFGEAALPGMAGIEYKLADADSEQLGAWRKYSAGIRLLGSNSGYINAKEFSAWLEAAKAGKAAKAEENLLAGVFTRYGLLLAALLIIPLGLMLNLTPCILPMIPINLSIIGAGSAGGQGRARGLLLGGLYGSAMALVYGLLGLLVVLTGSRFGAINSSAWFNLIVAAVFVFLALSMFDVFLLDFSRFRGSGGKSDNPWLAALLLGAISALLAGACVAPVLIWVLLLATDLYAKGNFVGLFLPLLLGLGMALPWPILGAGLSRLPKPGAWMERVKQVMGLLIMLFALYYAYMAFSLFKMQSGPQAASQSLDGWHGDLIEALQVAKVEEKPLLVYFWGVTCKSCTAMKKTTFQDPGVRAQLEDFVPVQFLADDSKDPLVAALLKQYQIMGMPSYVVLAY